MYKCTNVTNVQTQETQTYTNTDLHTDTLLVLLHLCNKQIHVVTRFDQTFQQLAAAFVSGLVLQRKPLVSDFCKRTLYDGTQPDKLLQYVQSQGSCPSVTRAHTLP